MKTKRWLHCISALACLAILLSALLAGVSLPKADAATVPGPESKYMYKYVHKNAAFNNWYDKMFYLPAHDSDVVFQEGDVYRLSFYYNIDDATYFPGQHDNRLPLDFGIGAGSSGEPGEKQYILQNAAKKGVWASADPQWYYITYDFTISAWNGYKELVGKALDYFTISPLYFGGTETVYLADIRLCPVVNGKAGASVISGICDKDTLQDWGYTSGQAQPVKGLQDATSRDTTCYTFSVLPYQEALFRRPDTNYMLKLNRKNETGESSLYFTGTQSVTFNEGDVYRLSFRYKVNDGSKFLTGGDPHSPFAIGLFHSGGKPVKLICDTVAANTQLRPSVDSEWNEIVYDYTVPADLDGKQLLMVSIVTPYYGSTDEIYLANLSLCPVTDGVAGDSLISTINRDADLSAWSKDYTGNSSVGRVTYYENDYFSVTVEEYDESLFVKPKYMYKYDRKNSAGDSKIIYTGCKSGVVFAEGDVYRLSFLYHAEAGSAFPGQHANALPVDFGIRNSSGSVHNILQSETRTEVWMSSDEDWYAISYDFKISATEGEHGQLIGWDLNSFTLGPLWYGSEETIYLADIRLCPVKDGTVGDTVLPGICENATLSDWYGAGAVTKYSNTCFDMEVLPYDESVFRRPLAIAQGAQIRSGTSNDLRFGFAVQYKGEVKWDKTTYEGNWTAGKVTVDGEDYPIERAGAVLRVAKDFSGDLTLDTDKAYDVPAKKLYNVTDDTAYFTAVLTKIPDDNTGTPIMARPYVVYEKDGQSVYLYGETIVRSYNQVKK